MLHIEMPNVCMGKVIYFFCGGGGILETIIQIFIFP